MTLDQLRVFVAVAELQHVTNAAAQLNMTQSSVSGAIAALETRHGVRLFDRVGRNIELTGEGAIFLEAARAVLNEARNADRVLADLGGLRRGSVTVFASQTIANFWLPRRLVRYHGMFPSVSLDVRIGNTAECVKAVKSGDAEIGLVEGETPSDGMISQLVAVDRLVLVIGRKHRWASAPPVVPHQLDQSAWALREPGSGTRSSFEHTLKERGFSIECLDVVLELPSNEALCAAVAEGLFATVVSESVAQQGIATGALVKVPVELGTREFRLIRHERRQLTRAAEAFRELLATRIDRRSGRLSIL